MQLQSLENLTVSGTVSLTLFDGPIGTNPRHTFVGNVVCDALRAQIIAALLTGITHFAFGTSNSPTNKTDENLHLEFQRKALLESKEVGGHLLGSAAIGYNDLVTASTTIAAVTDTTHVQVANTAGFRVGDYVAVNDDPLNTDTKFTTIQSIPDGTHLVFSDPVAGMDVGHYVLQLIQEAGVLTNTHETYIQSAVDSSHFRLASVVGFAVGDKIRVLTSTTGSGTYQYTEITDLDGGTKDIVVNPALSDTPPFGVSYKVDNGVLANHATGLLFRKTDAQTAMASVDIAIG